MTARTVYTGLRMNTTMSTVLRPLPLYIGTLTISLYQMMKDGREQLSHSVPTFWEMKIGWKMRFGFLAKKPKFSCCPAKERHLDICEHTLIATCSVFSHTSCTSLVSRCYILYASVPWLLSPTLQTDSWDSSHLFYSWLFPFFHPPTLPNVHTISLLWNHSWFVHWWSCTASLMSLKISLKARSQ